MITEYTWRVPHCQGDGAQKGIWGEKNGRLCLPDASGVFLIVCQQTGLTGGLMLKLHLAAKSHLKKLII